MWSSHATWFSRLLDQERLKRNIIINLFQTYQRLEVAISILKYNRLV